MLALKALQACDVEHVSDHCPAGTPDEDVFAFAAEKDWILVTQDIRIRRNPQQRQALLQAGIGCFIFTGRAQRSVNDMMAFFLARLTEILPLAQVLSKPYIVGIPDRGKLERLT